MSKAKLYIVRGLPSSGKTTLAKELSKKFNCLMYAADDLFESKGKYNFDAAKLGQAHAQCFSKTKAALIDNATVVVHNTFTTYKEMKPYFELIDQFECDYAILEPATSWKDSPDECYKLSKSTHNVPLESIIKMKNRWQNEEQILKLWQEDRNSKKNQEKVKAGQNA